MATTVFKFDDGSGHCAAKCFPARQKFKKNKPDNAAGAWLVAHNAELRRHFKAVLCSKPRTFEEIRNQRKKAEKEGTTIALQQSRQMNSDDGNILDGYFLLSRSCVREPTDLCSVDISGQSLMDTVQTDFELFNNLVFINAADNILNLEPFSSFPSLQELEMPVNGLRGFKLNSEMFMQLRKLDISFNNLSSADIASLGLLPQLKVLDISGNNLTHLPLDLCQTSDDTGRSDELLKFPALEELVANDNKLGNDSTFQALAGLPSLVRLSLQKNDIEKVPQLLAINGRFIVQDEQKVDGRSASKRTRRSARQSPQHCPTVSQPTTAANLPQDRAGSCVGSGTASRTGLAGLLVTDGRLSTGTSAPTSVSITVPRADVHDCHAATTETVALRTAKSPAENKLLTAESSVSLVDESPAVERTHTPDNRLVESSLFPAAPVTSAADVSRSATDMTAESSSAFAAGEKSDIVGGEMLARGASVGGNSDSEPKTVQDYSAVASPADGSLSYSRVANTGSVTMGETEAAAVSTDAIYDGSSTAMMTAPFDSLPGFDMCNFEFGELNISEPDAKPSRKSTANIGPLIAPFPQLQHLNVAFNKISKEESLLALAAWPKLCELLIHDNPLATSRKDQPIVNHFLKQRLGIQVFSKKPEAATKPHIEIPVKMHRVDDTVPSMPRCNVDELLRAIEAAPTETPALMAPRCKSASEIPLGTSSSILKTPLPPIATSSNTWTEDLCDNSRPHTAKPHTQYQRQQQEPFFMTETGENVIDDLRPTSPSVKSESCSSVALSTDLPHIYDGYELLLDVDESTLDDTLPPPGDINGNVRALSYALTHPLVFRDNRKEMQKQLKPYQPSTRKPDPLFIPSKTKSEKTNAILTNLKTRETYVEIPLKEALSQKRGSKERTEAKKLVSELQQKYVATRATSVLTTRQMINRLKDRSELMRVGVTVPATQHS